MLSLEIREKDTQKSERQPTADTLRQRTDRNTWS